MTLNNYEPANVWKYFQEIASIPHGSRNTQAIADYIMDFAENHSLEAKKDETGNVYVYKEASEGYEKAEPVILQGHMDMVIAKEDGCSKDMEKEGLELEVIKCDEPSADVAKQYDHDEWVSAKGTSLGADDGIAVAYMLAILESSEIKAPAITAVFTMDEEIGMIGAHGLDGSLVKGNVLINIDNETEGEFITGCAGGTTVQLDVPVAKELITPYVIELRIDGLTGGHSGVEIDQYRLNANKAMGRILLGVFQNFGMRILTIDGGEVDNAIPKKSEAAIIVLEETKDDAIALIKKMFDEIKEEYKDTDPDIKLTLNEVGEQEVRAFGDASTLAAILPLVNFPDGVIRMNTEYGTVETSNNVGVVRTLEDRVRIECTVRSQKESAKKNVVEQMRSIVEIFGGEMNITSDYTGWEPNKDSKVCKVMESAFKEVYGNAPVVTQTHAGLECGVLGTKIKNMDAISFGPQADDIHTADEKLSIQSVKRVWDVLVKTLEKLK